ncbi:Sporulation and spore germination [Blastococcus sp. DSM 46786]|uniref:GerMN domain-containing protein n=1 Tax=Blastococcus sp. DSM 46786 TaxID=1798227 RepID=UPI0008B332B8|nr:GerMN domain-containing protein [Blastococcus sp. DSM 46786]SEK67588.1 Sporulation and spore germination [Blastococcus sp. DSM 46786]
MRALAVVLCVLAVLTGCGVEPQPQPERIAVPTAPPGTSTPRSDDAGPEVVVFFVRGAELAPASRATSAATPESAVALLAAGPTRDEVIGGLRTAVAPQSIVADEGLPGGITAVSVTREFAGITGGNQLLAVAQVVWTLTELPGTARVRFLIEGAPLEVPTDDGLSDEPVGRDEFLSVAPPGAPRTPGSGPTSED